MNRQHVTLGAVVAVLGTIGALFYTGVEKAVELDQKLGRGAHADSLLDARLDRIEKRLRLKPGVEVQAPHEGLGRKILNLLW